VSKGFSDPIVIGKIRRDSVKIFDSFGNLVTEEGKGLEKGEGLVGREQVNNK
jgi:hypothetical protein